MTRYLIALSLVLILSSGALAATVELAPGVKLGVPKGATVFGTYREYVSARGDKTPLSDFVLPDMEERILAIFSDGKNNTVAVVRSNASFDMARLKRMLQEEIRYTGWDVLDQQEMENKGHAKGYSVAGKSGTTFVRIVVYPYGKKSLTLFGSSPSPEWLKTALRDIIIAQ